MLARSTVLTKQRMNGENWTVSRNKQLVSMSLCSAKMAPLLAVVSMLCGTLVLGAPSSKCPPGGKYYDKHVGQWGRWQCCSGICRPLIWKDLCRRNCPDYQSSSVIKVPMPPMQTRDTQPSDPSASDDPAYAVLVLAAVVVTAVLVVVMKRTGCLDRASRTCPTHRRAGQDVDSPDHLPLQELQAGSGRGSLDSQHGLLTDNPEHLAGERHGDPEGAEGGSRGSGHRESAGHLLPTGIQQSRQGAGSFQTAREERGGPALQPADSTADLQIVREERG